MRNSDFGMRVDAQMLAEGGPALSILTLYGSLTRKRRKAALGGGLGIS